jgi:hypothetical protein
MCTRYSTRRHGKLCRWLANIMSGAIAKDPSAIVKAIRRMLVGDAADIGAGGVAQEPCARAGCTEG